MQPIFVDNLFDSVHFNSNRVERTCRVSVYTLVICSDDVGFMPLFIVNDSP